MVGHCAKHLMGFRKWCWTLSRTKKRRAKRARHSKFGASGGDIFTKMKHRKLRSVVLFGRPSADSFDFEEVFDAENTALTSIA